MTLEERLKYMKDYYKKKQMPGEPDLKDSLNIVSLVAASYHDALTRCKVCKLKYDKVQLINDICKYCINS